MRVSVQESRVNFHFITTLVIAPRFFFTKPVIISVDLSHSSRSKGQTLSSKASVFPYKWECGYAVYVFDTACEFSAF